MLECTYAARCEARELGQPTVIRSMCNNQNTWVASLYSRLCRIGRPPTARTVARTRGVTRASVRRARFGILRRADEALEAHAMKPGAAATPWRVLHALAFSAAFAAVASEGRG